MRTWRTAILATATEFTATSMKIAASETAATGVSEATGETVIAIEE